MAYLNKDKLKRATDAATGTRVFGAESVEARALALGKEADLKGDKLIDFIYTKFGGAKTEEKEEKVKKGKALEVGVIEEEVKGVEVEVIGKKTKK
jgi:hypothetical protein